MNEKYNDLREFSFIEGELPLWQRLLMRAIEQTTGKRKLIRIYQKIVDQDETGLSFWDRAITQLELQIKINGNPLDSIPRSGPLLIVSNHPFGQIDGLVLGYVLNQVRPDFKLVAWDILNVSDYFKEVILPISFKDEYASKRSNLLTLKDAIKHLKRGKAVAIFPAGETALSNGILGKAKDAQWKKFTSKIVKATDTPVLPVFFHGQNSRLFQIIGNFNLNLKLSMFFHEICNMIGKDVTLTIGSILHCADYGSGMTDSDLMEFLYTETEKLALQPV
ncbi:MAG: 1-acyl-sn-glycerol-3-phosphate acyltransferase [Desulfosarcinaceae bacterium]|nr:1-acyl-sn-glycerol-3-phosphate acyltransferase [Desulfosarcinaceae bacterium]